MADKSKYIVACMHAFQPDRLYDFENGSMRAYARMCEREASFKQCVGMSLFPGWSRTVH